MGAGGRVSGGGGSKVSGHKRAASNASRRCLWRPDALEAALSLPDGMNPGGRTENSSLRYKPPGTSGAQGARGEMGRKMIFLLMSFTPSRGIPLPPWLWTNAMDRYNDLHNRARGSCGPTVIRVFPCRRSPILSPRPRKGLRTHGVSFLLGSLLKGFGLSTSTFLCFVSLRV